jgi:hypothetical protein
MIKDAEMYAGCVSGASEIKEYLRIVGETGFLNINIHKQKNSGYLSLFFLNTTVLRS